MAWRAASCMAFRGGLSLRGGIPAVTAASSFQRSPSLGSLRSSCSARAVKSLSHVRGRYVESTLVDSKSSSINWKIKMLYDGDCPLCMREVNMLRERNKAYGAIKFVDISSQDYSPEENEGLDYRTVMGRIHAILSDGTVVTDVEAFRRLYGEVGLGWVYAITKYEPVASIANAVYGVWAKYRLQITGRPPIEDIMESRKGELCNDDKVCRM